MRYIFAIWILFAAIGAPPTAAWAKDSDCWKKTGDVKLQACTRIIVLERLYGNRISKKNLGRAYYHRGVAHRNKGRLDQAIANYDKAITLNPKHANAYNSRGVVYLTRGEAAKAIADFSRALRIDPSHKGARDRLIELGVEP